MAKIVFKELTSNQNVLFPVSLSEKIAPNHPVRVVNSVVDALDISCLLWAYKGGGTSSYHPRMMLKVLFYAYLNNIYSCRKIEKALQENIHFMWLSGNSTPDFRTINSVSNSYNAGTVIDPAGMAGGITGYIGSDASVYNCYNMGKVTGGAISGDDCSESTLRSGEEELPSIIDCYYLEGAGSGTLAKALSASDFVTTINEKLFTDPNNGEDFPWDGKANLTGDRLSVPTFDSSSVVEVPLDDDPTATEIIAKGESHIQAIDGRICITTSEPMKVRVVNIAGQTVRTVSLSDGYSEMTGLAEGVYIVVLEDGTCVKVLLR